MIELFSAPSRLLAVTEDVAMPTGTVASPLTPVVIIVLCVIAGLATALLLPGRREAAVRRLGGAGLVAAALVLAGLLMRWTIDLGGMSLYFWAFSAIALFASVRVVTHTKPVYSALYFVLTVFASAGLFVLMWAEFMAAALVLIYAGAILITYVFVIMLASEAASAGVTEPNKNPLAEHDAKSRSPLAASIIGFAVAGLMIFLITDKSRDFAKANEAKRSTDAVAAADRPMSPALASIDEGTGAQTALAATGPKASENDAHAAASALVSDLGSTQALGQELIENHAIDLQLSAVILTVAMVGAITLARRRVFGLSPQTASIETLHTPNTPVDDNPHSIPVYGTTNPRHKAYPET